MKHYIYTTINKINGKSYVGVHSTSDRDSDYLGSGKALKFAVKKYGRKNFERVTLAECDTREEAFKIESILVDDEWVNSKCNYNLCVGGMGGNLGSGKDHWNFGKTHNEETRKRMSKNHYDASGKNNPFHGKTHTKESRKKMSDGLKGRKSPMKGKTHSDATKKKMSDSKKLFFKNNPDPKIGTKHTEATKEKMRLAKLGMKRSAESVDKHRKKMTGRIWITDGVQNKIVQPENIPNGWYKGRVEV